MLDKENPLPWFRFDRDSCCRAREIIDHVGKGQDGHRRPPTLQETGVAAAKAKVAPEADKPKDTTPKDRQKKTNITQSSTSGESEEDRDKAKQKHRKQSINKLRRQSKKRSSDESGSKSF